MRGLAQTRQTSRARRLPAAGPVAPAYSWTGCYAGVHVGYGWARSDVSELNVSVGPGGSGSVTSTLDSDGAVYGGQLGCNYQFQTGAFDTKWVVGIQGDFAGTSLRGDVADPFNPFLGGITGTLSMKTQWLASVTGRVGVTAWDNRALIYAKGGVAWVQNKWDTTASGYCVFYAIYNGCAPTLRDNRTGWTAGAGGEFLISPSWPNWTAFVEVRLLPFRQRCRCLRGRSIKSASRQCHYSRGPEHPRRQAGHELQAVPPLNAVDPPGRSLLRTPPFEHAHPAPVQR